MLRKHHVDAAIATLQERGEYVSRDTHAIITHPDTVIADEFFPLEFVTSPYIQVHTDFWIFKKQDLEKINDFQTRRKGALPPLP